MTLSVQTFGDIPTGEMVTTDDYRFANRNTWDNLGVTPDLILVIGKDDVWIAYLEAMEAIGRGEFNNQVPEGRRSYLLEPKTADERKADAEAEKKAVKKWIADQKSRSVARQAAREGSIDLFA